MYKELTEGTDFYFSEAGFMVLTEKYLLQKGDCCGNGCIHCPYNYKNVTEPQRSELLANRKSLKNRNKIL